MTNSSTQPSDRIDGIIFVDYKDESQLESVMSLVGRDLSEPYSSTLKGAQTLVISRDAHYSHFQSLHIATFYSVFHNYVSSPALLTNLMNPLAVLWAKLTRKKFW
jgi:hypothetical protein